MNAPQIPGLALALVMAATAFPGSTPAAETRLKVGDPAPRLQTGRWVQGTPVTDFERDKVYIVEFWATWCGPCRTSIPHLNAIHQKFKDRGLVVIGQDCWEQDESKVEPFIKGMGDKMTYRVALDDRRDSEKGKMAETWMEAANQNGIPAAFLVDKNGLIAWIGHPMALQEPLVEGVLAGTHDLKKAQADFEKAQKEIEAWKAARVPRAEVQAAIREKDWDAAAARLARAEAVLSAEEIRGLRSGILLAQRDYAGVAKLVSDSAGSAALQEDPRRAGWLNGIAWAMAIDPDISAADLGRAETIARQACEASGNNSAMILDTLARVLFRRDRTADAIALQEKAVRLAPGEPGFAETLESYRKGVLPKP